MSFYTNRETLKTTLLSVCHAYSNTTYMRVLQNVFSKIPLKKIVDIECKDLITMILTAVKGIDRGLTKGAMVIDYALSSNGKLNEEMRERYKNDVVSPKIIGDIIDFYSSVDFNYDLIVKGQDLVDAITNFEISGISEGSDRIRRMNKEFSNIQTLLESKVAADKGETVLIDSANSYEEGVDEIIEKMKVEDKFTLYTGSIFDKTTGGYSPTKLTMRASIAGGGKSVGLLNEALLIKDNPMNIVPTEVLNGLNAAVLYISFENTLVQTFKRVLAFYGYTEEMVNSKTDNELRDLALKLLGYSPAKITFIIKKLPRNTISMMDLKSIFREYENKGYKIIFFANDYIDLMDLSYTEVDKANSVIPVVKKTEELKALAEEFYLPISSAVQINRPGEIALRDAEKRMSTPDPITALNAGFIAGGHQVKAKCDCFDFIYKSEFKGKPYLSILNDKQRDVVKKDKGDNTGLYVSPMDVGGFKVMNDVVYKSAGELCPEATTTADVFAEASKKRKEEVDAKFSDLDKAAS